MHSRRFVDALISMGAFLLPLALYLASAYRDVTYWDVGEMDTVPWIAGIAHPPGFPLYVVIGWVFSHAFAVGGVAFRMSVLSALGSAAAAWCVYRMVLDEWRDRIAAFAAALVFASGLVVWTRATRAEVHAVEIAFVAASLLLALRWYRSGNARELILAAGFYGCAIAVHPVALLVLPALFVLLAARLHRSEPADVLRALVAGVFCAAVWFAYLPLRSMYVVRHHLDPVAALGIDGSAFWNYANPSSADGFLALIGARDIDVRSGLIGALDPIVLAPRFADALAVFAREFAVVGIAFVAIGAVLLYRRDRAQALAMLMVIATALLFSAGFRDESDPARYYVQGFLAAAYCCGGGLAWLRARARWTRRTAEVFASLIVLALIANGRVLFGQPHDTRARSEVTEVLARTPDRAVIVATWVLAPPLAYAAYVEHRAGHRIIVPLWYGETADMLPLWMRKRPVYVAGTPEGSVDGFRLERLSSRTQLFSVVYE